jgi:hypothetical protein
VLLDRVEKMVEKRVEAFQECSGAPRIRASMEELWISSMEWTRKYEDKDGRNDSGKPGMENGRFDTRTSIPTTNIAPETKTGRSRRRGRGRKDESRREADRS